MFELTHTHPLTTLSLSLSLSQQVAAASPDTPLPKFFHASAEPRKQSLYHSSTLTLSQTHLLSHTYSHSDTERQPDAHTDSHVPSSQLSLLTLRALFGLIWMKLFVYFRG